MTKDIENLITQLKEKELTLAFVTAGGGVGLFELFKIPGCSAVMNQAHMLYSKESFESFLKQKPPEKYVSQQMADALAFRLSTISKNDLSLALTCALSTDRKRKGDNHGFLSMCKEQKIVFQKHFSIEGTDRQQQDQFTTQICLQSIYEMIQEK